jgi:hypothetical protein
MEDRIAFYTDIERALSRLTIGGLRVVTLCTLEGHSVKSASMVLRQHHTTVTRCLIAAIDFLRNEPEIMAYLGEAYVGNKLVPKPIVIKTLHAVADKRRRQRKYVSYA